MWPLNTNRNEWLLHRNRYHSRQQEHLTGLDYTQFRTDQLLLIGLIKHWPRRTHTEPSTRTLLQTGRDDLLRCDMIRPNSLTDSKPECGARPQQSWLATIRQDQCQLYISLNNVTVNSQPAVCYGGSYAPTTPVMMMTTMDIQRHPSFHTLHTQGTS